MRLFKAINFNNEMRARLLALRDELRDKSQCVNSTREPSPCAVPSVLSMLHCRILLRRYSDPV